MKILLSSQDAFTQSLKGFTAIERLKSLKTKPGASFFYIHFCPLNLSEA